MTIYGRTKSNNDVGINKNTTRLLARKFCTREPSYKRDLDRLGQPFVVDKSILKRFVNATLEVTKQLTNLSE